MSHSLGQFCAGFDEAGRGCLAGPVIAAAVVLPADITALRGLTDSKKLTPNKREALARLIRQHAVSWALGRSDPREIDRLNILQASLLAMRSLRSLMAQAGRSSALGHAGSRQLLPQEGATTRASRLTQGEQPARLPAFACAPEPPAA